LNIRGHAAVFAVDVRDDVDVAHPLRTGGQALEVLGGAACRLRQEIASARRLRRRPRKDEGGLFLAKLLPSVTLSRRLREVLRCVLYGIFVVCFYEGVDYGE
jgi:hypothetical protein